MRICGVVTGAYFAVVFSDKKGSGRIIQGAASALANWAGKYAYEG
jgi:hypothetical protein